jgi:hypothetical protein
MGIRVMCVLCCKKKPFQWAECLTRPEAPRIKALRLPPIKNRPECLTMFCRDTHCVFVLASFTEFIFDKKEFSVQTDKNFSLSLPPSITFNF